MSRLYRSAAAILCLSVLTFFVESTSAAAFKRVHAGDEAPAFTLPDLDGTPVSLDEHKDGPLTIVTFWALWSPKSEPLLQDIQKILDEFGDQGLAVKAIAVNEDGEDAPADFTEQVKGLIERNGLKFPVVVDHEMEEYARWGVIATPSTAFLGKQLKVEYEFSGHPTSAYLDMRAEVMKALGIEEKLAEAAKPKRARYHAEHRVLLNFGLAKTLFERGQLKKSLRKLKKVLAEDPEFPDAHALNGLLHLGLKKDDPARAAFDKAVELDATVPTGLAGQAHYALQDGDTAKALERIREAVKFTEDEELPEVEGAEEQESMAEAVEERTEQMAAETDAAATAVADAATAPATEEAGQTAVADAAATAEAPTDAAAEPTAGEDAAQTAPADQAGADADTVPQLAEAAALLSGGDEAGARALLEKYVAAYLAIPEGPHMSAKGQKMRMLMMKQQQQANQ